MRAATSVSDSGREVILIESSDDDHAANGVEMQQTSKGSSGTANGPRGCNQDRDGGEGFSSQDVACLEFDDVESEDEFEV